MTSRSFTDNRGFFFAQIVAALLLGLALRIYFIWHFPFYSGDTKFYEELGRNWLDHGVYGLFVNGTLTPVDMRVPGYPGFLAAIYFLLGRAARTVMVAQAFVDLGTCALTALIAARLAPAAKRKIVGIAALWMAALCPFTANYTAVVLTEVLATFLTTLTVLVFVYLVTSAFVEPGEVGASEPARAMLYSFAGWFLLLGFIAGVGTLVRPETPLVLGAMGVTLIAYWWRPANWRKLILAACWMCVGLLLPLMPWAARNARTFGRVEFLGPRYAETYGDFIPRGFFAWTQTWMTRFGEAYAVTWKLGNAPLRTDEMPSAAFDSAAERVRVTEWLTVYNSNLRMTPVLDQEFANLARERTGRRALRTYIFVPAARVAAMWFTPRIELLPYSGELLPAGAKWRGNPADFGVTLGFGILGFVYAGLALVGWWRSRTQAGVMFLGLFIVIRTIAMTQLQTVEPRYVIECLPAVLVLGALALAIGAREGMR